MKVMLKRTLLLSLLVLAVLCFMALGASAATVTADSDANAVTAGAVVRVGDEGTGTYYDSLGEALTAATEGSTVTFLTDVELTEALRISQTVTFDLNGHKLTLAALDNYGLVIHGDLTITGEGYVHANGAYGIGLSTTCTGGLTVENGTFTADESNVYLIGAFNGTVTINDGSFTSPYCVLNSFDGYEASAIVTGGTFDITDTSDESASPLLGINIVVSGGTYHDEIDQAYCAEGYILTYDAATGTYGSAEGKYEAMVGDKKYDTFENALLFANAGDTITLLTNVTVETALSIDKNLTIDGAGSTLTSSAAVAFTLNADLTIEDLIIDATAGQLINITGTDVDLTIKNSTLTATGNVINRAHVADEAHTGDITITNTSLSSSGGWALSLHHSEQSAFLLTTTVSMTNVTVTGKYGLGLGGTVAGSAISFTGGSISVKEEAFYLRANSSATFKNTTLSASGSRLGYVCNYSSLTFDGVTATYTGTSNAIYCANSSHPTILFKNKSSLTTESGMGIKLGDAAAISDHSLTLQDGSSISAGREAILINSGASAYTVNILSGSIVKSTANNAIELNGTFKNFALNITNSTVVSTADSTYAIEITGSGAIPITIDGGTVQVDGQNAIAIHQKSSAALTFTATMKGNALISATASGSKGMYLEEYQATFSFYQYGGKIVSNSHAMQLKVANGGSHNNLILIKPTAGLDNVPEIETTSNNAVFYIHGNSNIEFDLEGAYLKGANAIINKTNPGNETPRTFKLTMKTSKLEAGSAYAVYVADASTSQSYFKVDFTISDSTITSSGSGGIIADGDENSTIKIYRTTIETNGRSLRFREYMDLYLEDCIVTSTNGDAVVWEQNNGSLGGMFKVTALRSTITSKAGRAVVTDSDAKGTAPELSFTNCALSATGHTINSSDKLASLSLINSTVTTTASDATGSAAIRLDIDAGQATAITIKNDSIAKDKDGNLVPSITSAARGISLHRGSVYTLTLENVYIDAAYTAVHRSNYGGSYVFNATFNNCIFVSSVNPVFTLAKESVDGAPSAILNVAFNNCQITSKAASEGYAAIRMGGTEGSKVTLTGSTVLTPGIAFHAIGDVELTLNTTKVGTEESPVEIGIKAIRIGNIKVNILNSSIYSASHSVYVAEDTGCSMELNLTQATITANTSTAIYANPGAGAATFTGTWFDSTVTGKDGSAVSLGYNRNQLTITLSIYNCTLIATQTADQQGFSALRLRGKNGSKISIVDSELKMAESSKDFTVNEWAVLDLSTPNLNDVMTVTLNGTDVTAYKGTAIRQREKTSNTVLTLTNGCVISSASSNAIWSSNGHITLTIENCDINGGTGMDINGAVKAPDGSYTTVTVTNTDFVTTGTAVGLHSYIIATFAGGTIDADGKGFDTNSGDVTLTVDGLTKFETGGRTFEVGSYNVSTTYNLTVKNVTITSTGGDGMFVCGLTDISVCMEKVTIDAGYAGIYMNTTTARDTTAENAEVTVIHPQLDLKDITITSGTQGIFVDADNLDPEGTYANIENITITVVAKNNGTNTAGGVGLEIDQVLNFTLKGKINIDTTGASSDQEGLVFYCNSTEAQHTINMTEGLIQTGNIAVHLRSHGKINFTMTGGRIVSNNNYAFKFEWDNEREINVLFDELNEETPDIHAKNGRAFSIHGYSDTVFNIVNANIKAENENAIHATDPDWETPCTLTLSVENSLITSTTHAGLFIGRNADLTLTDTTIHSKGTAIDKGVSSVCNIFKLTATDCIITSTASYGINAAQSDEAASTLQMTIVLTRTDITAQRCLVIDACNSGEFKSTLTMTAGSLTATESCLWNKEDLVATFKDVTMSSTGTYGIRAPMSEMGGDFTLTLDSCSVTNTRAKGDTYGIESAVGSTYVSHHVIILKGTTSFNITASNGKAFGLRVYSGHTESTIDVTVQDEVQMHVSSTDKSNHNSVLNLDGSVLMTLTINLKNAYGEKPNFTHDSGYGIHMQTGARRPTISITNAYFDVYRLAIYSADGGSTSTITIKDSKFVAETNKGVYLGENKTNTVYLTMENCYVSGATHGLEVGAKGYVTIKNSTFIADSNALDLRAQNSTGDVYSTVYNCTITGGNTPLYLNECKNVIIEKCIITAEDPKTDWEYNNRAIYVWSYVDATLKDCTVTMDGDFACAIYYCDSCTNSTLTLDNTTVTSGLDGAYINQTINCKLVMKNKSSINVSEGDRGIVLYMADAGDSFTLDMDNSSITSKLACISFNDGKDVTDIGTLTVIMKNGSSLTNKEEGNLTGIANADARDSLKRHGYGIFIWDKINLNLTVENSTITSAGVAGVYLHRHGAWDVDVKNSTITCTGKWGVAFKLFSANNASVDLDFHNTTLTGVRAAFEADGHTNDLTRYYSFTYDELSEDPNITASGSNVIWLRGAGHFEIEFKNAYVAATKGHAVFRTDGVGAVYTLKATGSKFTSPDNAAINIASGVNINAVTKLSLTNCTVIGKTQGLIVAGKVGGASTLYIKGGYYSDTAGTEGRSVGSGSIQVSGDITITLEGVTIHSYNDCAIRQSDSISTMTWTITDCIITSDGEYGFLSSNGNCDLTLNGTTSIELSDTDAATRGVVFQGAAYSQSLTIADTVSIIVHGNGSSHAVHATGGTFQMTMTGGYLESNGHTIRLQCNKPGNFIHIQLKELNEENPDIVSHNDSAIYIHNQYTYDVKLENVYLKGADYAFGKTNPGASQITRLDMYVSNSKLEGGNWTLFMGWGDSQIMDVHASFYNTEFICGSGLALDGATANTAYYFEGCTITAGDKAIYLSDELKLTMKDCVINSTSWGIYNHEAPINGSTLDITIEDCEFNAELSAIYIRRTDVVDLTLTVKDSTLHSNTGFAVIIGANTNDPNGMANGSNNMVDVLIENCQISGVRGVGVGGMKGSVAVLNNNTITAGRDVIYVTTDIAVTINGGTITSTLFADWTPAIYAKGIDSVLTMNGVTVNAIAWGVYLADDSSPDLYLNNCVINAVGAGVRANGVNGVTVEIKDCEINVSRMTDGEITYGGTAVNFAYLKGAMNLTVENCVINCPEGNGIGVVAPSSAAARTNIKVTDCSITAGATGIWVGTGTWHNTELRNNTVVAGGYAVDLNGLANSSAVISGGSYETTEHDAAVQAQESVVLDIYSGFFLGHRLSTARVSGDAVMNIYGGYFHYTGTLNPKTNEDHGNVLRNGTWSGIKSCQINVFGGTFVNDAESSVFYSIHGNPVNLYSFNAMGGNNIYTDSNGEFTPYPNNACMYALNNPVMINGAQVRLVLSENQAGGIRFTTTISAETLSYIERLADTNAEFVIGTVIVPLDYLENLPAFTLDALESAGLNYLNIIAKNGLRVNRDGSVTVRAAITEIKEQNYDRAFAAIAYVKSTVNGEDVYYYSNFNAEENARSLKQLANAALSDTSTAQNSTYRFEVLDENGVVVAYSRYTDEQQAVLNRFNNCTYTETVVKEPTATEPGLKEVHCPSCGTHYEELIPPTGEEALLPDEAA
ncbi:MAG: right-handed parallel beta-helix repeat-containing protein [Clostridia bacterium]|nr:right-handed parallel beta-helix repeat-containing protein [Clostridia bacterium]